MESSAFVGVSLDSNQFSRTWVRAAISYILARHSNVQFVLADQLLAYNKTACETNGNLVLDFSSATARALKRKGDIHQFFLSEVGRLPEADQLRVSVATWDDYADPSFSRIARSLLIGYSALPVFRSCVDHDVEAHFSMHLDHRVHPEVERRLCACYVLEETAMIIRITELAGKPFDYYPQDQIETLQRLYEDAFSSVGLTIDSLIGRRRSRIFTPLPLAEVASLAGGTCTLSE